MNVDEHAAILLYLDGREDTISLQQVDKKIQEESFAVAEYSKKLDLRKQAAGIDILVINECLRLKAEKMSETEDKIVAAMHDVKKRFEENSLIDQQLEECIKKHQRYAEHWRNVRHVLVSKYSEAPSSPRTSLKELKSSSPQLSPRLLQSSPRFLQSSFLHSSPRPASSSFLHSSPRLRRTDAETLATKSEEGEDNQKLKYSPPPKSKSSPSLLPHHSSLLRLSGSNKHVKK